MIRVHVSDGSIAYRNEPYMLDLLPGNKIFDKVEPSVVFFHRKKECAPLPEAASSPKKQLSRKIFIAPSGPSSPKSTSQVSTPTVTSDVASPKFAAAVHYATVSVKFGSVTLIAPFRVATGDQVVIEADDGGVHLGVVAKVTTTQPKTATNLKIIRRARPADLKCYAESRLSEASTAMLCQQYVDDARLSLVIKDVEWQLDRGALTVLLSSSSQNELDDGYKVLQSQFQCRIWLLTSMPLTADSHTGATNSSFSVSCSSETSSLKAECGI